MYAVEDLNPIAPEGIVIWLKSRGTAGHSNRAIRELSDSAMMIRRSADSPLRTASLV